MVQVGRDAFRQRLAVHPAFVAGGVAEFVQRGLVIPVRGRKLLTLRECHLVGLHVVKGTVAAYVGDVNPALVNHPLGRLVRFPLGLGLAVLGLAFQLQAVGLLDVEHGVGAHQRRAALLARLGRLPRLVARAVLTRALLVVELVEQNVGALLTFTDLSAKLLDLLVGAPSVIGVPLCGLRHAQVERVPASVRSLAGDVRRKLRLARLPRFLPRRNPRLDLLADLAGKLLVVSSWLHFGAPDFLLRPQAI